MSTKNPTSKALSLVLPAGAVGASLLLALSAQAAILSGLPVTGTPETKSGVAARLKTIREGVAAMAQTTDGSDETGELVRTWWGNGGWGRWHPGWGNGGWHNGGWGNGGWHNGGWGNGGWGNGGWGNGGWHNWGNGWNNFWHNA